MTARELKDWMLASIEALRAGKTVFSDGVNVTDKDLFIIEHFVRQFPISKRKEVRKNEDADDQADVQHGPDGLADTGG